MSFLQLLAPSCTPKSLSGTIFDTLMKTNAAVDAGESRPVVNGTSEVKSNRANATNGNHERSRMNVSNGAVGISTSPEMDKSSQTVKRAIVDPKPVMHSYVCSVVNSKGMYPT